jgi:hypothetical protein
VLLNAVKDDNDSLQAELRRWRGARGVLQVGMGAVVIEVVGGCVCRPDDFERCPRHRVGGTFSPCSSLRVVCLSSQRHWDKQERRRQLLKQEHDDAERKARAREALQLPA